jgi:hypothetical protein
MHAHITVHVCVCVCQQNDVKYELVKDKSILLMIYNRYRAKKWHHAPTYHQENLKMVQSNPVEGNEIQITSINMWCHNPDDLNTNFLKI